MGPECWLGPALIPSVVWWHSKSPSHPSWQSHHCYAAGLLAQGLGWSGPSHTLDILGACSLSISVFLYPRLCLYLCACLSISLCMCLYQSLPLCLFLSVSLTLCGFSLCGLAPSKPRLLIWQLPEQENWRKQAQLPGLFPQSLRSHTRPQRLPTGSRGGNMDPTFYLEDFQIICGPVLKLPDWGLGSLVAKTLPSSAEGEGSIPVWRAKIPCASWPKNQNIKQKQHHNKFNKDFKKVVHIKNKKILSKKSYQTATLPAIPGSCRGPWEEVSLLSRRGGSSKPHPCIPSSWLTPQFLTPEWSQTHEGRASFTILLLQARHLHNIEAGGGGGGGGRRAASNLLFYQMTFSNFPPHLALLKNKTCGERRENHISLSSLKRNKHV